MSTISGLEQRLRDLLRERSITQGDFVLASGGRSTFYIDARRTTMAAEGLAVIGALALERLATLGWRPDVVGGLTLGADPVAFAIAAASRGAGRGRAVDAFSVRKEAKTHGTGQRIEGCFFAGAAVVIVEDVITTGRSALEAIGAGEAAGGSVLLLLGMPADIPVVAVGASTSHRVAAQAVAAGASDYFALPDDRDGLRDALAVAVQRRRAAIGRAALSLLEAQAHAFREIVGESPALRAVLERAARVVPHAEATVLLTGETGTGKELLARALHYGGPRAAAPFVELNCAALPAPLLESELFGHERGAFTDARTAKPGLFEVAEGGTLFLDEIDRLAPELQGKLLRALEQKPMRRLGATVSRTVDVRSVAATNTDLAAAVQHGLFREDLYYRL